MNDTPNQTHNHPLFKAFVILLIGLVAAGSAYWYGNDAVDWYLASQYQPSTAVASINTKLQLTSKGETLFYASDPVVEGSKAFNSDCKSVDRTQAILGCYTARRIFVYHVTNPQLDGAEEATAAHELLHAAYARLNVFERPYVDNLINQEYQKVKNEPQIKQLVAYYNSAEPGALTNELHSIFGTTIQNLSPQLEQYYAQYFKDRQSIVAMNQQYNAVFNTVDAQASQLSSQITALKPTVEAELSQYQTDINQLNADITSFNAKAQSGNYSVSELQAERQALVVRINELNARRQAINGDVAHYNDLVAQLNALSVTVNELTSSINAAPAANGL